MNEGYKILISSERVRIISRESGNVVVKEIPLDKIGQCVYKPRQTETGAEHQLCIEIYNEVPPEGVRHQPDHTPRLACRSQKVSLKISQDIQYAIDLRRDGGYLVRENKDTSIVR